MQKVPATRASTRLSVQIVHRRWGLHSQGAGYDTLFEHIRSRDAVDIRSSDQGSISRISLTYSHHALRAGKHLVMGHFNRLGGILADASRRLSCAVHPPNVIHIGVIDELVGSAYKIRRLFPSAALLGTVHLPPNTWRRQVKLNWEPLKCLDALIVLSTDQKRFFSRELPATKVVFIPHGVDTNVFHPAADPVIRGEPRIIFVGTHMRSFSELAKVIPVILANHATACFDLVIPSEEQITPLIQLKTAFPDRVFLHDKVPASSLVRLYQRAHVAFLPLTDATANNSILEAFACGVPVVTTAVGGTPDYVNEDCGFLVSSQSCCDYIDLIVTLLRDTKKRKEMGIAARVRAQQLSWDNIADKMIQLYRDIYSEIQSGTRQDA